MHGGALSVYTAIFRNWSATPASATRSPFPRVHSRFPVLHRVSPAPELVRYGTTAAYSDPGNPAPAAAGDSHIVECYCLFNMSLGRDL